MRRVVINQQALLVCNIEGILYAIDDMCTHEDASLYLGCLKNDEVQCSLHGGRFNVITGQPTEEPAEIPLNTYPVSIQGDDYFIEL